MPVPVEVLAEGTAPIGEALDALHAALDLADPVLIAAAKHDFAVAVASQVVTLLETHDYAPSSRSGMFYDIAHAFSMAMIPNESRVYHFNEDFGWQADETGGTVTNHNHSHNTLTGGGTALAGPQIGIVLDGSGLGRAGVPYVVTARVNGDLASDDTPLRVGFGTALNSIALFTVLKDDVPAGGGWITLGTFTNVEWDPDDLILLAFLQNHALPSSTLVNTNGSWDVYEVKVRVAQ